MGIRKVGDKVPMNPRIMFGLCLLGLSAISTGVFLYFYAHGFRGYTESFYMTAIGIYSFFFFLVFFLRSDQIFKLIDSLEEMIAKSDSKCIGMFKIKVYNFFLSVKKNLIFL